MKKYLLIASIFLSCNAYAQLVIGDLKIEPTTQNNWVKITNISNESISLRIDRRLIKVIEPNKSITASFPPITKNKPMTEKEKKEQEQKALLDLLNERPIH